MAEGLQAKDFGLLKLGQCYLYCNLMHPVMLMWHN